MTYFLLAVAAVWLLFSVAAFRNAQATPRLPALAELPRPEVPPRVSVVVAARDEGARIEQTVRRLLAQRDVALEIVVVDDRSTDDTPAILARLAAENPALRTLRVEALPHGWLGKCHACSLGAAEARGEWLLFADGDSHLCEDLLARAVATAERDGAAHLTLWPSLNCTGTITRASVLAWGQMLSAYAPPARINRDRGRRGIGVGAFNLVRADAYRAIGGHEPLRIEVVDDVKLGMLLRRAGFRQRLYGGTADLECEWAHGVAGVVRAVEKNWFAGMNYNLPATLLVLAAMSGLWLSAALGPLLHPWAGWVALGGLLSPIVPAVLHARDIRWPLRTALLVPLGFVTFIVAGAHSTWKTIRQGGIRWRDTFYPLKELRAGVVR